MQIYCYAVISTNLSYIVYHNILATRKENVVHIAKIQQIQTYTVRMMLSVYQHILSYKK